MTYVPRHAIPGSGRARPSVRVGALAVRALLVAGAVVVAGVALLGLSGWRLLTVTTPSMSPRMPVGALVVISPLHSPARPGQVLAFRPPGDRLVYVHRVVEVVGGVGYRTKGDNDALVDPWVVPAGRVVGRSAYVLPDLGWLRPAAPLLAAGLILAAVVGYAYPRWRWWALVDGASGSLWLAATRLHLLVQWQTVTVNRGGGRVHAWAFNTGILPLVLRASPGGSVVLAPGHSGVVSGPANHAVVLEGSAALHGWLLAGLVAFSAAPLAVAVARSVRARRVQPPEGGDTHTASWPSTVPATTAVPPSHAA